MLAVCLYGPTGVGKTALALRIAADFDVEVVSVDSAMVYRGMDIGTAKPSAAERARVPHHLIDVREPWEHYSAGAFRDDALAAIRDISSRGRTPLLVGGTMLYFRALWRGLADLPVADPAVRADIDAEARRVGWPALHAELAGVDPVAAARIRPADRQRIQRALEVWRLTGSRISELQDRVAGPVGLRFLRIAVEPADRAALYQALDERLLAMTRAGLLEEVRRLAANPLMSEAAPAMRAVGYRQLWCHLAGGCTLPEAVRAAQQATRHLAKRQLTWMRAEVPDLAAAAAGEAAVPSLEAFLGSAGVSRRA